jgi:hypothetical protein
MGASSIQQTSAFVIANRELDIKLTEACYFALEGFSSLKGLKYLKSIEVAGGYVQLFSSTDPRAAYSCNDANNRPFTKQSVIAKFYQLSGGVYKPVFYKVGDMQLAQSGILNLIRSQSGVKLFVDGSPNSKISQNPLPSTQTQEVDRITLPSGRTIDQKDVSIHSSSFSVDVTLKDGSRKRVQIFEARDGKSTVYLAADPKTKKLVPVGVWSGKGEYNVSALEPKVRALYVKAGLASKTAPPSVSDAPSQKPRPETFKLLSSVSNTLALDKDRISDFGSYSKVPGAITFEAFVNGKQEQHRADAGMVQLDDGKWVAAARIAMANGKSQVIVLENIKYDPNNPTQMARDIDVNLAQMHANGKFAVDATSRTGFVRTPTEAKADQKKIEEYANFLLNVADVAFLFSAGKGLWTAARTYLKFNSVLKAGRVLTAAEQASKKAAEAVLVGYGIGAVAGGSSYGLFVKRKYWDEATAAIASGKSVESLSAGAKALLQLMNWTLGAGKTSADVALWNVATGRNLATVNLSGTAASWQKGWNWGMFVDVRSFTNKNILTVFGRETGQKMIEKYGPVLEWMTNPANKPLDAAGKLVVPAEVLARAGFADNPALVADMMKSGFWRVFSSAPVLGTPLRVAWTSSKSGTASSYLQLGLTRSVAGMGVNLFWQSVNGLVLNNDVNINFVQLTGSGVSGPFRAMGAPGAWLAEIGGRFVSYGLSSAAAFFVAWGWRDFWKLRAQVNPAEKDLTKVTFSVAQLQILSRANTATNAMRTLMVALDKNTTSAPQDKKLLAEYMNKLADLSVASKETLEVKAKALDAWLDSAYISGTSRRQAINNFRLDWEPGLALAVKAKTQSGAIVNGTFTGSFQDLGIAPIFSKVIPIKAQNE